MRGAASILALCSLFTAGCAIHGSKPAPKHGEPAASTDKPGDSTRIVRGPVQIVGRVVATDPRTLSVMVELAPFAVIPPDFSGRILVSRQDDLRPTARLQASPYMRGRILGTRLLAGQAQIGDEVVFAPANP